MSKKTALKSFRVTKRFELWVETQVKAEDFSSAVEAGKALKCYDFLKEIMKPKSPASICDETELAGFGVTEDW